MSSLHSIGRRTTAILAAAAALALASCASRPARTSLPADNPSSPTAPALSWSPPPTAYQETFGLKENANAPQAPGEGMQMEHGAHTHSHGAHP